MKNLAFLLLLSLISGCTTTKLPLPNFMPPQPHIKVLTYNVNWGFRQPDRIIRAIERSDADIVFVQETHRTWEKAFKYTLKSRYPYQIFKPWGGAGGIGFMSRYPLKNVDLIKPEAGWFPALKATSLTPLGKIELLNVHLRPPLGDGGSASVSALYTTKNIRKNEIEGFIRKVATSSPCIVAGDFNEDEDGKAMNLLSVKCGFQDALSLFDTHSDTWRWPTLVYDLSDRYDHILANNFLKCTGAKVTDIPASDHMPVEAVFIKQ